MGRELFSLKGTKEGLILAIAPDSDFSSVMDGLKAKLAPAKEFWEGATVTIDSIPPGWTDRERIQLLSLLGEFDMSLKVDYTRQEASKAFGELTGLDPLERSGNNALLIKRNLRSGQRIVHDGNLIVAGDVNPGAEVVATGDIVILGTLRGMAHAGSQGNTSAVVIALRLQPMQLRIAHHISRSPDGKVEIPDFPEIAVVKEDRISVQQYFPQHVF